MRTLLILVLIVCLAGCGQRATGGLLPGRSFPPSSRVLVTRANDGQELDHPTAKGSGAAVTAAVRDGLIQRHFIPTLADDSPLREQAAAKRCPFILAVSIVEWEDNATVWSGHPDHLAISLELTKADDGDLVATVSQFSKSSWLTIIPGSPADLIPKAVPAALDNLLRPAP